MTLRDYVEWKLTHSNKTADAEGYPLVLKRCKAGKRFKKFYVYGSDGGVGNVRDDGKYELGVRVGGKNLFDNKNFVINALGYVSASTIKPTDTGIEFIINGASGSVCLAFGLAKDFEGCTLTMSSPDYYGSVATVLNVRTDAGTNVTTGSNWAKKGDVYVSTITIPKNSGYTTEVMCIRLYVAGSAAGTEIRYNDICVEMGDTASGYEAYVEPEVQMVAVDNVLGADDYIDFAKGAVYRGGELGESVDVSMPNAVSETSVVTVVSDNKPDKLKAKYDRR